jgi:hypothetical protein
MRNTQLNIPGRKLQAESNKTAEKEYGNTVE